MSAEREPAAWETSAAGPFVTMGVVSVFALGEGQFRIKWPEGSKQIEGHDAAIALARDIAGLPPDGVTGDG